LVVPTNAASAPCIVGKRYSVCDECPYFTAKDVAIQANVATMNYAYFLAELNYAGGFQGRELLVLDEAHNAEAMLMSFVQLSVNEVQLRRAGVDRALPPDFGPDLGPEMAFEFVEDLMPELKRRSKAIELDLQVDS